MPASHPSPSSPGSSTSHPTGTAPAPGGQGEGQDKTDTLTDPPTSPASRVISTPSHSSLHHTHGTTSQEAYRQVKPPSHQHLPCAQVIQGLRGEGASPLSAEQCTPRGQVSHLLRTLHPEAAPFLWLQGTMVLLCNPEQGGPWRPLGLPPCPAGTSHILGEMTSKTGKHTKSWCFSEESRLPACQNQDTCPAQSHKWE